MHKGILHITILYSIISYMINTKTILVVDDDISVQKVLKLMLEKEGFSVFTSNNGKEGLESAIKNKPDLIILDMAMPIMDGHKMLKALRTDSIVGKTPVMVLSNSFIAPSVLENIRKDSLNILIKTDWKLQDILKEIMSVIKLKEYRTFLGRIV